MRVIYVYDKNSEIQRNMITRASTEIGSSITELKVANLDDVKDTFNIRATPAVIILRDDLQGENLLNENTDGSLLITALLTKYMDEEDKSLHQQDNNRLDLLIKAQEKEAQDKLMEDMITRGVI
ncbi:hypothetical protein [Clostridium sp.]|uniref:hypothetical protein n=1 Tax=Clostridium sp. TaxID=1506 RepID=UPI0035A0052F